MKINKKIIGAIIAVTCSVSSFSCVLPLSASAEGELTYGDLTYTAFDSNNDGIGDYISIISCNESAVSVNIPSEIDGLPVTKIEKKAFYCNPNIENVTFPESLNYIGEQAFYRCTSLKDVVIPENITTINQLTFCYCSSLESVSLPENLKSIGRFAFSFCSDMKSITVSENNAYFTSLDGVLFNKDKTSLILYPIGNERTGYAIPDGVTKLEDTSFTSCEFLEKVTIPDTVTMINSGTFEGCSNLKSVVIPNSVTYIGGSAFEACTSLASVKISKNAEVIESRAFLGCESLKSVFIPNSVTKMEERAFDECTGLINITIENPDCYIFDSEQTIADNVTIYGDAVSTAKDYAEKYNKKFSLKRLRGDVSNNNEIDLYDAIIIAKYILGKWTFTEEDKLIADYNDDENINLYDVIGIAKFLVSKRTTV